MVEKAAHFQKEVGLSYSFVYEITLEIKSGISQLILALLVVKMLYNFISLLGFETSCQLSLEELCSQGITKSIFRDKEQLIKLIGLSYSFLKVFAYSIFFSILISVKIES